MATTPAIASAVNKRMEASISTIAVPVIGMKSPASKGTRAQMAKSLKGGWDKYGKFFKQAAEASNLPVQLLMSFAFVESTMNPNAATGATTGLMQWNRSPGYADAMLTREFKMGRMNAKEKEILKRKGVKWTADGIFSPITAVQQLDPELNILIGAIYLGQYADSIAKGVQQPIFAVEDGVLRIDRIIPLYNTGEGSSDSLAARSKKWATPVLTASNASNPITRNYGHIILGKDGTMDILTKELKDIVV